MDQNEGFGIRRLNILENRTTANDLGYLKTIEEYKNVLDIRMTP